MLDGRYAVVLFEVSLSLVCIALKGMKLEI